MLCSCICILSPIRHLYFLLSCNQVHHDAVTSIMKHNSLVFVIGKMLPSKSPIAKCENTDYELCKKVGRPLGLLLIIWLGGRLKQVSPVDLRYAGRAMQTMTYDHFALPKFWTP